jgi:hypothetical protein
LFITFKPENNDPQMWEFDPKRVRASQAEMVEKRYGQPWDTFLRDLIKGSMLARRVLLWHLTRLTHHTLRYEDTPDFYAEELLVEFSRAELETMRAEAEKSTALSDEDRPVALAALDAEIAKAPTGVDEGKAPSPSGSSVTG